MRCATSPCSRPVPEPGEGARRLRRPARAPPDRSRLAAPRTAQATGSRPPSSSADQVGMTSSRIACCYSRLLNSCSCQLGLRVRSHPGHALRPRIQFAASRTFSCELEVRKPSPLSTDRGTASGARIRAEEQRIRRNWRPSRVPAEPADLRRRGGRNDACWCLPFRDALRPSWVQRVDRSGCR
jgi:hypothetical protein